MEGLWTEFHQRYYMHFNTFFRWDNKRLWNISFHMPLMHLSSPSLTTPPPATPGICMFSLPRGSSFRPTIFAPEFESEKFPQFLTDNAETSLSNLFKKNLRQLAKQVFLCCFILIFAKEVDVSSNYHKIDHFWYNFTLLCSVLICSLNILCQFIDE